MICLLTGRRSTCAHPLIIIAVLNHVASLLRSQKDVAVRETCIPDPPGHNKLTASWVIGGPHAATGVLLLVHMAHRPVGASGLVGETTVLSGHICES